MEKLILLGIAALVAFTLIVSVDPGSSIATIPIVGTTLSEISLCGPTPPPTPCVPGSTHCVDRPVGACVFTCNAAGTSWGRCVPCGGSGGVNVNCDTPGPGGNCDYGATHEGHKLEAAYSGCESDIDYSLYSFIRTS